MKTSIYTHSTLQCIQQAQEGAQEYKHTQLMPEHMLFAMLHEDQELIHTVLEKLAINSTVLRLEVEKLLDGLPKASESVAQVALSNELANVFQAAEQ